MTAGLLDAEIPYQGSGFSGSHAWLVGSRTVPVAVADLARVAVTIGHPGRGTKALPRARKRLLRAERHHRATVLRAFLRTPGTPGAATWEMTNAYLEGLESTEKGGVGYTVGMLFAATVAEVLLSSQMALHTSMYTTAPAIGITFQRLNKKGPASAPDLLLRQKDGTIHAMEAKARFNPSKAAWGQVMGRALDQARAPLASGTIDGARVASGVDIAASGSLSMEWRDPAPEAGTGDPHVNHAAFVRAHYGSLLPLFENESLRMITVDGRDFEVMDLPEADVQLGLDARLRDIVSNGQDDVVVRFAAEMPDRTVHGRRSIGPDGVMVILGDTWGDGEPATMEMDDPR